MSNQRTNKTPRRAVEVFKSIKPLVFFVFILVKNTILTNMGSIVTTHVLILFLAVFSRTLKQEQKRISSTPALHDCSRERGRGVVIGLLATWLVSLGLQFLIRFQFSNENISGASPIDSTTLRCHLSSPLDKSCIRPCVRSIKH